MGIEEYVDLDLDDFQRRSNERLLGLIERARSVVEAEFGRPFTVVEDAGRLEIHIDGRAVYHASSTASGRLLLTDVSGRYSSRL